MSRPEGPEQPWEEPSRASAQDPYPDTSSWPAYEQYAPQQYPPDQYPPQQWAPQQWAPGQYEPGHQQPPAQQPYWEPQYGQYDQQPPGGFPLTAPPNRPSGRTPVILAIVAVVVVALAVVGVVVLARGGDTKQDAQTTPTNTASTPTTSTTSSTTAPTSPSAPPSESPEPTSAQQVTVPSVISGWQGVLSDKENVAYDVPPGWKVETPDTLVGFADAQGRPVAVMHGVSTYKNNACPKVPGSSRGQVGFKTAGDLTPTVAARAGVQLFAKGAAIRDNGTSAPVSGTTVSGIRVDRGRIAAEYARATVRVHDSADCGSPTVVVVGVAFRTGPTSTALFIGYFDQGVSGALPLSTARRIFTSLRPYHG